MKFTEEQFNILVKIQEDQYSDDLYFEPKSGNKAVEHVVENNNPKMNDFIEQNNLGNEAVAIMNPRTREWAHEQFVEKDNKYVWTLKKVDKNGIKMHLYKDYFGRVCSFLSVKNVNIDDSDKLTETEIKEWGYNPEMFTKEEVE
ncbi:hypothetical protein [Leuconostoc lactis]|uniref:hypothetical protein n=1 Tax=Leuconostoc lactis TaxID=1246 RepID=UPI0024AE53B5|nr:hypothetical protein [Leuconostoc lactis]MDI6495457.1 hypothetical protein [Leuconostoc lactis]